jgi:hypothetical protein
LVEVNLKEKGDKQYIEIVINWLANCLNRKDKVIVGLILNEGDSPSLVAVNGSL